MRLKCIGCKVSYKIIYETNLEAKGVLGPPKVQGVGPPKVQGVTVVTFLSPLSPFVTYIGYNKYMQQT